LKDLEVKLQEKIDWRCPGQPQSWVLESLSTHEGLVDQGLVVEIPDVLVHSIESSEGREKLSDAQPKSPWQLAGVDVGFLDVDDVGRTGCDGDHAEEVKVRIDGDVEGQLQVI